MEEHGFCSEPSSRKGGGGCRAATGNSSHAEAVALATMVVAVKSAKARAGHARQKGQRVAQTASGSATSVASSVAQPA